MSRMVLKEQDLDKFLGEFFSCKALNNFCKSIVVSKDAMTRNKLYELLDSFLEEIDERNVVPLIKDWK